MTLWTVSFSFIIYLRNWVILQRWQLQFWLIQRQYGIIFILDQLVKYLDLQLMWCTHLLLSLSSRNSIHKYHRLSISCVGNSEAEMTELKWSAWKCWSTCMKVGLRHCASEFTTYDTDITWSRSLNKKEIQLNLLHILYFHI